MTTPCLNSPTGQCQRTAPCEHACDLRVSAAPAAVMPSIVVKSRMSNSEYEALMEAERPAFEEWAGDYGRIFQDREGAGYKFPYTQEAWVGWLARAAYAIAEQRDRAAEREPNASAYMTEHGLRWNR